MEEGRKGGKDVEAPHTLPFAVRDTLTSSLTGSALGGGSTRGGTLALEKRNQLCCKCSKMMTHGKGDAPVDQEDG